jgi:hypothetical protein
MVAVLTSTPWPTLLQQLTEAAATWGVWKDPRSAFEGEGDIDSVAERADWPAVVGAFGEWSRRHGFGPVVLCTHYPDLLIVVACDGERPTRLLQMDVYACHVFRGTTLVTARQLGPLMHLDPRGFRRLRPGAEALLVLLRAARRGGGRPAERVTGPQLERIGADRDGARRLAQAIGLPLGFVRSLGEDRWGRRELAAFELRAALGLLAPRELARCVLRDYRRIRGCTLVDALARGRRVDGDRAEWLTEIRRTHDVHDTYGTTTSRPEP